MRGIVLIFLPIQVFIAVYHVAVNLCTNCLNSQCFAHNVDGGLAHGQSIAGAPFNPGFLRHASLENLLSSDAYKQQ